MINKEYILIFLIVVLAIWVTYPYFEGFDATGREFVDVGEVRYGLRGDKIRRVPIQKYFIRPDRNIRLSQSNGMMWESNNTPAQDGIKGCSKTQCPTNSNEFDSMDTCWSCGNKCPVDIQVPGINVPSGFF